ncbi:unnamed protein product, partial [marine sediment metagenome]
VGSALNGLELRIKRHLSNEKNNFWHIDYFLQVAKVLDVITIETSKRTTECKIAKALADRFDSVNRFGSSDCHCNSHLFFEEVNAKPD